MASRWKTLWLAAAVVAAVIGLPGAYNSEPVRAGDDRLVVAFYYAWYDQKTWTSGNVPDVPRELYNSSDRQAMARQIDQAKGAGIDAFIVNWWGKGNQTETNLRALLEVAAQKGFRVAVDFDPNSPFMHGTASYVDNLKHLLADHAAQSAYLRYQGRPAVFFYNVSRLPVSTWRSIRDQADPNRQALWIAEGTDTSYLSVFDGHHLYSITWPNRTPPSQTLSSWGDKIRKYNRDHGTAKLWVATVMPGYDDRRARAGGFVRSRDGGEYYRQGWRAAIASKPQWVVINSFNEWPEGTYVEPSQAYGGLYLDLTREWAGQFKGASFPAAAAAALPTARPQLTARPTPRPTPAPSPTPVPADYAVDDGWLFTQRASSGAAGFTVTNEDLVPFWEAFRDGGGSAWIGYPISPRYKWQDFVLQSFEQGVLAWHPRLGRVYRLSSFDEEALVGLLAGRTATDH